MLHGDIKKISVKNPGLFISRQIKNNKKAWIFHGDIFDVTMQHSKWLAKLGAIGYDTLILINSMVNWGLKIMGKPKMSFSQKVKAKFKDAVSFINHFEQTAADLA